MSADNNYVNLSFVPKDKRNQLRSTVFEFFNRQKNFNRLSILATTECSKVCIANLKSDKLNSEEVLCLTNCATRFFDALNVGDNVFNRLNNREVDLTPFTKGNFDDVINKV